MGTSLALVLLGCVSGCAKKKPPSRELTMERWAKRQAERGIQVSTAAVLAAVPRPAATPAPAKAVVKPAPTAALARVPAGLIQGTTVSADVKMHRIYDYNTGTRDPFLPLIGTGVGAGGASEKVSLPTAGGAFNLNVLTLRGILWSGQQPMAILSDSAGGAYIVRDGRVVDSHGKEVRGVTGIIKPKSVILTTASRTVRELKMEIAGAGGAGGAGGTGAK